jgi:hypothetical protein
LALAPWTWYGSLRLRQRLRPTLKRQLIYTQYNLYTHCTWKYYVNKQNLWKNCQQSREIRQQYINISLPNYRFKLFENTVCTLYSLYSWYRYFKSGSELGPQSVDIRNRIQNTGGMNT